MRARKLAQPTVALCSLNLPGDGTAFQGMASGTDPCLSPPCSLGS